MALPPITAIRAATAMDFLTIFMFNLYVLTQRICDPTVDA